MAVFIDYKRCSHAFLLPFEKSTSVPFSFQLFAGNVVFMGYNASLTVALSVVRPRLPFDSLEGLLESNYRQGGSSQTVEE